MNLTPTAKIQRSEEEEEDDALVYLNQCLLSLLILRRSCLLLISKKAATTTCKAVAAPAKKSPTVFPVFSFCFSGRLWLWFLLCLHFLFWWCFSWIGLLLPTFTGGGGGGGVNDWGGGGGGGEMDESCDCESTKIEAETRETKSTRNRVKLCNGGSMDSSGKQKSRNSSSSTTSKSQNC